MGAMGDNSKQTTVGAVRAALERGHRFVTRDVWRIGLPGEDIPSGFFIKHIRVAILVARGMAQEALLLRASALTFATLLFLVPFFTLVFVFIQTFNLGEGVYGYVGDQVDSFVERVVLVLNDDAANGSVEVEGEPEGALAAPPPPPAPATPEEKRAQADRLIRQLTALIFPNLKEAQGTDANLANPVDLLVRTAEETASQPKTIGLTGVLFVLTTVFGMMRNIEWAFNMIWGVKGARSLWRTLQDYAMITLLLPFVMAAMLGVTAALQSVAVVEALGPLAVLLRGGQYLLISATLALLYYVVPHTRVKKRYALIGGLAAGALWVANSSAYVGFSIGLQNYTLFFQAFALFPMLMMWLYVSWIIVLLGCLLTYAYQNEKTFALNRYVDHASFAYQEALGVRLAVEMARRFRDGQAPLSVPEIAEAWNVPPRMITRVVELLEASNVVAPAATDPVTYLPARDPKRVRVDEIVGLMRHAGQEPSMLRRDAAFSPVYEGLDQADTAILGATIDALAKRLAPAAAPAGVTPFPARDEAARTSGA